MLSAGVISAVLGFLSAITLGIPAWQEIRERRHWDALKRVKDRLAGSSLSRPGAADQVEEIQWSFVEARMGKYFAHRRTVFAGFVLLALSFAFDIVDNWEEAKAEATPAASAAPKPA